MVKHVPSIIPSHSSSPAIDLPVTQERKAAKAEAKAKAKAAKDAEKTNIKALKAAVKDGDPDAQAKLDEAEATYETNKAARKAARDAEKKKHKEEKALRKAGKVNIGVREMAGFLPGYLPNLHTKIIFQR